jgi:hypothetical protein
VRYCVTSYENEKDEFWAMLEEDKVNIHRKKDELLIEKIAVKEVVSRSLRFVPSLAREEHEIIEFQVMKLAEAIKQLQARVTELEIQEVPSTPQERWKTAGTSANAFQHVVKSVLKCFEINVQILNEIIKWRGTCRL